MTDYKLLIRQAESLIDGVSYCISNLSNISALLYDSMENINWAGFYLMRNGELVLGPFQGKTACTTIPIGKGVCGTAAFTGETQLVYDVHQFSGHIACDSASNSEVVVPIRKNGTLVGVLDIDSPAVGRFTSSDAKGLETLVHLLEKMDWNAV